MYIAGVFYRRLSIADLLFYVPLHYYWSLCLIGMMHHSFKMICRVHPQQWSHLGSGAWALSSGVWAPYSWLWALASDLFVGGDSSA